MAVNEGADRTGKEHHENDGYDDSAYHQPDLSDHSDCRDHRVEGEHGVEQNDLNDHADEAGGHPLDGMTFLTFQTVVDLVRRFANQEETAANENQIAA